MKNTISICGNIGSGKSTIIKYLQQQKFENIHVIQEPLCEMQDLLTNFYEDTKKWSFHLQCKVLLLYHKMRKNFSPDKKYIIERSPFESKHIFAEALFNSESLTPVELSLYNELFEELSWKPDYTIYIKTSPELCLERIKNRNRECEANISLKYIQNLHTLYEQYFEMFQSSIISIDGSQDIDKVVFDCINILNLK